MENLQCHYFVVLPEKKMFVFVIAFILNISALDAADAKEEKTWLFAFSERRNQMNFVDVRVGVLTGFGVDVMKKVCEKANKNCESIYLPSSECATSVGNQFHPGRGLMAGWFDGCPGFAISQDRMNSVAFTQPYRRTEAHFAVAPGNPTNFTLEKLATSRIVHLAGSYTNRFCLESRGYEVGNVTYSYSSMDARLSVLNGANDVYFTPRSTASGLEVLNTTFNCDLGGIGVMSKKGSSLSRWWNKAFDAIYKKGEYQKICDKWKDTSIRCL